MKDLRYGIISSTQFSFAADDYRAATGYNVEPKVFAFIAESNDLVEDWDKLILMAENARVRIIIIDIHNIVDEQVEYLINRLKYRGFERDLKSYEDRLCFTCD